METISNNVTYEATVSSLSARSTTLNLTLERITSLSLDLVIDLPTTEALIGLP